MGYVPVFELKLLVLSRGARQAVGGIVEELQQCFHRYFVESFSNEVTKFVLEFRVSGGVGRFDGEGYWPLDSGSRIRFLSASLSCLWKFGGVVMVRLFADGLRMRCGSFWLLWRTGLTGPALP